MPPFMKGVVHSQQWFTNTWHGYFDLRRVRTENRTLRDELALMRVEQVRLMEDANQARRLQLLLGFKEKYISQTLPAQVISTTGSEFSRGIYIDKGAHDGVKVDMPVITPEGILGKILRVYPATSLVLEVNDPSSGIGVILEKSRLQGILKGDSTGTGELQIHYIMSDERVEVGEHVFTSGGDRIFPKGLPVGVVAEVAPGTDRTFLKIRVKSVAQLSRAEEVLVITKVEDRSPQLADNGQPIRAVDILADRLPTVTPPAKDNVTAASGSATPAAGGPAHVTSAGGASPKPKPTPGQTAPASGTGPTRSVPAAGSQPAATIRSNPDTAAPPESNTSATPSKTVTEEPPASDSTAKDSPR